MSDARVERMQQISGELEKLGRHEQMTGAQEVRFQQLRHEFNELDRADQLDQIKRQLEAGNVEAGTHYYESGFDSSPRESAPLLGRAPGEVRDTARRAIDRCHRGGHLPDYAAERATALVDTDPATNRGLAARWAAATGDEAYQAAFAKLLGDPQRGHMLFTEPEAGAYRAVAAVQGEMRAMGIGTDAGGGFMVPLTLDPAILLTSDGSSNPMRRTARRVQTATDSWNGVTSAGVTAAWYAEHAEVTDDSPTLAQPSIPVHRGSAFIPFSFEYGMDAPNALNELQKLLLDGADQLQAEAFTTGSGSGQPTGIITALAGTAAEVSPTTAETFASADVYKVIEALAPRWRPRARWQANLSILNDMAQMETGNGALLFPQLASGSLLMRPIDENSNMDGAVDPAVTAENHVLLAGDFQQFVIVDRIGATIELVPHLLGANRRPTGERGAFLWFRTGSDVTTVNAFRLLNIATTA